MENREIIIEVEDLVKRFGQFIANDNISFNVYKGEVFGFLGANGAGKTTAIRILTGLSRPSSGKVNIAGFDAYTQTEKIKKVIGYMSQKFSLYDDLTVYENIRLFGGIYGLKRSEINKRCNDLLARLEIQELRDRLIGSIPLGWKQKLAFSISILHNPRIVFLDEPTGGVDPIARRQFWDLIYEAGKQGITVFVTTHYMDEAEYCDRVCILADGQVKALGKPDQLKESFKAKTIDDIFYKIAREYK